MKKVLIIAVLGVLAFGASVFVFSYDFTSSENSEENSEENIEDTVARGYAGAQDGLLNLTQDDDFIFYVNTTLEENCPFYVPDGVTYRDCLYEYGEVARVGVPQSEQTKIEQYCEEIVSEITGTGYGGMLLSCEAYHFEIYASGQAEKMYKMEKISFQ